MFPLLNLYLTYAWIIKIGTHAVYGVAETEIYVSVENASPHIFQNPNVRELANLGSTGTFLLYGIFALVGLVFILRILPETKGKSLEELEAILVK